MKQKKQNDVNVVNDAKLLRTSVQYKFIRVIGSGKNLMSQELSKVGLIELKYRNATSLRNTNKCILLVRTQ